MRRPSSRHCNYYCTILLLLPIFINAKALECYALSAPLITNPPQFLSSTPADAEITVEMSPELAPHHSELRAWLAESLDIVSKYFAAQPSCNISVFITEQEGGDLTVDSQILTSGERKFSIGIGRQFDYSKLGKSSVLAKEFCRVFLPFPPSYKGWLFTGLASYVEPIARHQRELMTAEDLWLHFYKLYPENTGELFLTELTSPGESEPGGLAYYLILDMKLHELSGNQMSLQKALRSVTRGLKSINPDCVHVSDWLAYLDEFTGTNLAFVTYLVFAFCPVDCHKATNFELLGVKACHSRVEFKRDSCLAKTRLHIENGTCEE